MENNAVEIKDKEEKTPKTTKQKVFLGLKIFGNVVFYAIIIALFLFSIFNINGGNKTNNFPNIFGRGLLSVQSDSMTHSGETDDLEEWSDYKIGGFDTGDLLNVKVFNQKTTSGLKIGDVITFYTTDMNGDGSNVEGLVTHRIVYIATDGLGVVTQGDKRAKESSWYEGVDNWAYLVEGSERANSTGLSAEEIAAFDYYLEGAKYVEVVNVTNIRGVVTSVSVGGGKVLDTLTSSKGYFFIFVLPVAVILLVEIFLVIRNIMVLRGEKNKAELEGTREQMMSDLEKEKERMRQELLAEMRAQGLVTTETPAEETQADEPEAEGETMDSEAVEDNNVESNEESTTEPVAEETESVEETTEDVVEDNTTEEEKKENE